MTDEHDQLSLQHLVDRLDSLEKRITRLESKATVQPSEPVDYREELKLDQLKDITGGAFIESKFGESGLAWLGNIVLFLGITFFEQYIDNAGHHLASALFGYISVTGIFIMARLLKPNYPQMASIFNLNAYVLLFYVTLRLHFFTAVPLVESKTAGLILLFLVAAFQVFTGFRKKSALLTGMGLVFYGVLAVVGDTTPLMLSTLLLMSLLAVFFLFRMGWMHLVQLTIVLVYVVFLMWFLNNPIMGNPMQAVAEHQLGYLYLFAVAVVFSIATLAGNPESLSNNSVTWSIILNGLGFSTLLMLVILTFFKEDYVLIVSSVSLYCLVYSVLLQTKTERRIAAALYALYGFLTLSIAVYGYYGFPQAYFLLAIQSLLVVSMAIWFRSKFIVGMNTILYIVLLLVYANTSGILDSVNISFSLAALVTARILSWQKDRLTMKTDILRNIYLIIGFVMVLITLYFLIPPQYITLSWVAAALLYFILSLVLKNVKYRFMALGSIVAATFYLFIVDLAKIELVYRVIALMFLASISIGLSIFYTRRARRKIREEAHEQKND